MSGPRRLYIPRETAALSVGADDVAAALAPAADARGIDLVRNGSWGLSWLEPMVEIEVGAQRVAYGPVTREDVPSLLDAELFSGGTHALSLGTTSAIPYLSSQQRWAFERCGRDDPLSLDAFRSLGGFAGFESALALGPDKIIDALVRSGLRGRGGAGFPTGVKWRTVADAPGEQKYVACNADEGDSGTFSDRVLMESDPYTLIEGMLIAGLAVGANRGYIYLRSEYPLARSVLETAIETARQAGWLGRRVQDSDFAFDIELHIGGGSYVCGEETAMLESLEGKAGLVRYKPPLPAIAGLFGMPTVVNNVVTLASVPEYPRSGCRRLRRVRHWAIARHLGLSTRRQRQARRPGRTAVRHDLAQSDP